MARILASLAVLAAVASVQAQTVKVEPMKPKAGDTFVWGLEMKFTAMGQEGRFTGKLSRKILSVDDKGVMEIESKMVDGKVHIMDNDMDQPSEPSVSKVDADGEPVGDHPEPGSEIENVMSAFARVKWPKDGAAPGAKWTLAKAKGKSEIEYVGPGKWNERDCLITTMTFQPEGSTGTSEGKVYLDAKTGVFVGYEVTFTGISVAQGITSDGAATMIPLKSGS
ncbi:MAG: hypothetical protein JST30_08575 [Armatimonadetes bacterium]|nr:hypothetical protein [Armatimonadota bacterium]